MPLPIGHCTHAGRGDITVRIGPPLRMCRLARPAQRLGIGSVGATTADHLGLLLTENANGPTPRGGAAAAPPPQHADGHERAGRHGRRPRCSARSERAERRRSHLQGHCQHRAEERASKGTANQPEPRTTATKPHAVGHERTGRRGRHLRRCVRSEQAERHRTYLQGHCEQRADERASQGRPLAGQAPTITR